MMIRRYLRIFVVILLLPSFISSCLSKVEKPIRLKTHYPSGELRSENYISQNGILVDTAHYYYKNGFDSLIEVRNDSGILNGDVIFYYDNGNIEQRITYVDGLRNGIAIRYYNNEKVESINYYLLGKIAGDAFGLTVGGKRQYYSFYDFEERARTYMSWDNTGRIKTNIGGVVYVDTVRVDEQKKLYWISLIISNPPMTKTKVVINYFGKDKESIKIDTLLEKRFYSKKGKLDENIYGIKLYGIQFDSANNQIRKDSSFHIVKNY